MEVVTIREFRLNQTKILNKAKSGESIVLTSRTGSFKLLPISETDSIIDKRLCEALDEVKAHIAGELDLPEAKDLVF